MTDARWRTTSQYPRHSPSKDRLFLSWFGSYSDQSRIACKIERPPSSGFMNQGKHRDPAGRRRPPDRASFEGNGGQVPVELSGRGFRRSMRRAIVNVQYRLARIERAPAAVEDCLCALRWVIQHADEYNFDRSRIVTTGNSAGGHLALTTGMVPASAGLDRECPGPEPLSVAAVVNWYGITDIGDLLDGPNMKTYAVTWMGSLEDRFEIAKRVSPMTYVRAGLPPILSIHGDADPAVPY